MSDLLLVGCGKMGGALLAGWQNTFEGKMRFTVVSPHAPKSDYADTKNCPSLADVPADCKPDVIVLAVKPQQLDSVLPEYAERFGSDSLYISIAAGKTVSYFKDRLGDKANVIRIMPNTPVLIGKGMSVIYAPADTPASARELAEKLMKACGEVTFIKEESLMDAAAAVSGSGPAYIFLFLETLTKAGIKAGLSEGLASELALHTLSGATRLVEQRHEKPEKLRQHVTSPGGMTQAALDILMRQNGLQALMDEAVSAAQKRAKELNS